MQMVKQAENSNIMNSLSLFYMLVSVQLMDFYLFVTGSKSIQVMLVHYTKSQYEVFSLL